MNKLICMVFKLLTVFFSELFFRRSAILAFSPNTNPLPMNKGPKVTFTFPFVFTVFKADVSLHIIEACNGKRSVRILGAIHTSSGEKAGQFRDGDTVKLFFADMVDAFLKVRDLIFKTFDKPLSYFPKEDTTFACRVKELCIRIFKQILRQHIQHLVCHFGRSEDFIIRQIRKAEKHIGVIDLAEDIGSPDLFWNHFSFHYFNHNQ